MQGTRADGGLGRQPAQFPGQWFRDRLHRRTAATVTAGGRSPGGGGHGGMDPTALRSAGVPRPHRRHRRGGHADRHPEPATRHGGPGGGTYGNGSGPGLRRPRHRHHQRPRGFRRAGSRHLFRRPGNGGHGARGPGGRRHRIHAQLPRRLLSRTPPAAPPPRPGPDHRYQRQSAWAPGPLAAAGSGRAARPSSLGIAGRRDDGTAVVAGGPAAQFRGHAGRAGIGGGPVPLALLEPELCRQNGCVRAHGDRRRQCRRHDRRRHLGAGEGLHLGLIEFLAGALVEFAAFGSYSEFGVFDAATGSLTATPVGWTLSQYLALAPGDGPVEGWDEFKGYLGGETQASE